MKIKFSLIAIAILATLSIVGCSAQTAAVATAEPVATATAAAETDAAATDAAAETDAAAATTQSAGLELTLAELAQYNGKDGNPAYVAVDGIIYDVTNLAKWKNGEHNGYTAGQDLTDIIKNKSPHGVSKLEGVPVVGTLVAE